jgi:Fe-S cluster biogenesis protein NfuA
VMADNNKEFQQRTERIDALIKKVSELPDNTARATALELLQELMNMNAFVLNRMLDLTAQAGEPGDELIEKFATDPIISGLLVLYDLHPDDLETRIVRALDKVRPYLKSHGGDVELIGINESVVNLRLVGSCNGCAGSTATLKTAVEQAIFEAAPEIATVVADGTVQSASNETAGGFVPLAKLQGAA